MARESEDVTELLQELSRGDGRAVDRLLPLVYDELRSLAGRFLRDERSDHTLQATALVHEAYVRLVRTNRESWDNRAHFYRVAATAMRRVLVDHARRHRAAKRGGSLRQVTLTEAKALDRGPEIDLLALDEALAALAEQAPQKAQVVELRFFGGLTNEEVAKVLEVTSRTVERDWSFARAWLQRELRRTDSS